MSSQAERMTHAQRVAYLDRERGESCEHGHLTCAPEEGGACTNELAYLAECPHCHEPKVSAHEATCGDEDCLKREHP